MMSTVCEKSTPGLRSTSAFSGTAARSSARTSFSDPLAARPIGVRIASTMTASGMKAPQLTDRSIIGTAAALLHRFGGQPGARGERLVDVRRPDAEEPGGERVARAGGVDDVDRQRALVDRLEPVRPRRAARAARYHDLRHVELAPEHLGLVLVGQQQVDRRDAVEEDRVV